MKTFNYFLYLLIILQISCKNFLDEKPDASLKEANSLEDLDALLNNTKVMNYYSMGLGEASADNYYLDKSSWEAFDQHERQLYTWGEEIFYQFYLNPWLDYYKSIYYSNHVLAKLDKIASEKKIEGRAKELRGKTLFFRAFGHYKLLSLFSKAYDIEASKTDLGIPLRLSDDFNIPSERGTVEACYQQILKDLHEAEGLLPLKSDNIHLPSRISAYVLLSWIYQARTEFDQSVLYAQKALEIDGKLKDYKEYSQEARYPFFGFDDEIVYIVAGGGIYNMLGKSYCKIDTLLYSSYDTHDLRKKLFFERNNDGSYNFKGSYVGSRGLFMGLTVADAYLNLSEGLIRLNKIEEGLRFLEIFQRHRYDETYSPPLASMSQESALKLVLDERRKEFIMRDSRWGDIKRLNKIDDGVIIPARKLGDSEFSLKRNDNRYALPLPAEIIELTDMPQNPR
ncbi:RagB/SusD family nutrient uptake outer membrane protein [Sphingobacterium sp. NGMCC 1.201703]|uniref:RagB/SusD family nutrient uptake outer membrane protein n=1 Tax=Sphingobacterium sp. NGMCC 1.201703 TaxID=3388657 RepID=UPI0039FD41CD